MSDKSIMDIITEKKERSEAELRKEKAIDGLGRAMNTLTPEEKKILSGLKKEVELAQKYADETFDKRLEFCYAIHFASDRISNQRLMKAVKEYIDACQES